MQFSQIFVATNEHIPVFVGSLGSEDECLDMVLATVCGRTIILLVMAESWSEGDGIGNLQKRINLRVNFNFSQHFELGNSFVLPSSQISRAVLRQREPIHAPQGAHVQKGGHAVDFLGFHLGIRSCHCFDPPPSVSTVPSFGGDEFRADDAAIARSSARNGNGSGNGRLCAGGTGSANSDGSGSKLW